MGTAKSSRTPTSEPQKHTQRLAGKRLGGQRENGARDERYQPDSEPGYGDELEQQAVVGSLIGNAAANVVAHGQIEQDQPDQVRPNEEVVSVERREQPGRRKFHAEHRHPAEEDYEKQHAVAYASGVFRRRLNHRPGPRALQGCSNSMFNQVDFDSGVEGRCPRTLAASAAAASVATAM